MIEYNYQPTGLLYTKESKLSNNYSLKVDIRDNLIQQVNPLPNKLFKPSDGWKKTNEPEDHLDEISEEISGRITKPKVLCFSYKDESLAKRLTKGSSNYDILFDEEIGIIKESPDEISFDDFKKAIDKYLKNYNSYNHINKVYK